MVLFDIKSFINSIKDFDILSPQDKEEAIGDQEYEKAAALRDEEKKKKEELDEKLEEWRLSLIHISEPTRPY